MTYRNWKPIPSWETSAGKRVYPLYSWGAPTDKYHPGGVINVFDADVKPEDCESPQGMRHYIGQITWFENVIEWIDVHPTRWREGIATEMFTLARSCAPDLRHADDAYLSDAGRAWIAGMEKSADQPIERHWIFRLFTRRAPVGH